MTIRQASIADPFWTPARAAAAAERAKHSAQLEILQSLSRHPAWQVFMEAAKVSADSELNTAFTAADAHKQARHMGAAYGIRTLISWLDRELQSYKLALGIDQTPP